MKEGFDVYWIQKWSQVRQDEVVRYPEDFEIHSSYLKDLSKEDLITAYKQIWNIFINIYEDISTYPTHYGMPLFLPLEYGEFTKQARDSRSAPYRPLILLYNLLISGDLYSNRLFVDTNKFKQVNKIKNVSLLFERLTNFGFTFEGLNLFKIVTPNLSLFYEDNRKITNKGGLRGA